MDNYKMKMSFYEVLVGVIMVLNLEERNSSENYNFLTNEIQFGYQTVEYQMPQLPPSDIYIN